MSSRLLGEGGAGGVIILPTASSLLSAPNGHSIAVPQNTSRSFYSCLSSYATVYSFVSKFMCSISRKITYLKAIG